MSYTNLYQAVQEHDRDRISTRWLKEKAIELSHITRVKEQWSSVLDPSFVRGFYIEGPLGPPIPLNENECLIGLSREMCNGHLGAHWRRFVYTKELMHVFDEDDEKTDTKEKFDAQIEKFSDPNKETTKQFRAEQKAFWRALGALCTEKKRAEYRAEIEAGRTSIEVVATALQLPAVYVTELMRADFPGMIAKLR